MDEAFKQDFAHLEKQYPGITQNIWNFRTAILPACIHCGFHDTADVQVGVIGRTIVIGSATRKIKLIFNGPRPGRFFCNACEQFFTPLTWREPIRFE